MDDELQPMDNPIPAEAVENENVEIVNSEHRHKYTRLTYTIVSLSSAFFYLSYALYTREQFYITMMYVCSSKVAYFILGNAAVSLTTLAFRATIKIFLGELRDIEKEMITEQLRWSVTELFFALTIFREEIHVSMVLWFLMIMLAKSLHWAVEARGVHLQQMAEAEADHLNLDQQHLHDVLENHHVQRTAFERMRYVASRVYNSNTILAFFLLLCDTMAAGYTATQVLSEGPNVQVLFGFEFAILAVSAIHMITLHFLHVIDTFYQCDHGMSWPTKGVLVLAGDMAADGLKFAFYGMFFAFVFSYYGLPIHLIRDLYMSYTKFHSRLTAFLKYNELTRNMNDRFRNATEAELEACGHICIICRDNMEAESNNLNNTPKLLPCGHVFHFFCLRQWLQQQQSCPTCRKEVKSTDSTKDTPVPSEQNNNIENLQVNSNADDDESKVQGHELNNKALKGDNDDVADIGKDQQREDPTNANGDGGIHSNKLMTTGENEEMATASKNKKLDETTALPRGAFSRVFPSPLLYTVMNAKGARVWKDPTFAANYISSKDEESKDDDGDPPILGARSDEKILRVIPKDYTVLCPRMCTTTQTKNPVTLLQTPDDEGWMFLDDLQLMENLSMEKLSIIFNRELIHSLRLRAEEDTTNNSGGHLKD